jgi:hypothetical protein
VYGICGVSQRVSGRVNVGAVEKSVAQGLERAMKKSALRKKAYLSR